MFDWERPEVIEKLSRELFGYELASKIANGLEKNPSPNGICNSHRDYCGQGLVFHKGKFLLVEVYDGWPNEASYLNCWDTKQAFIEDLAKQSDYSCSGADKNSSFAKGALNNQRITKERLEEFKNIMGKKLR